MELLLSVDSREPAFFGKKSERLEEKNPFKASPRGGTRFRDSGIRFREKDPRAGFRLLLSPFPSALFFLN